MLARHRVLPRAEQIVRSSSCARSQLRAFSTTELSNGIKIAYDLHEPPSSSKSGNNPSNAPPIIFLHGLFGSKKNNRSMIYALDLRNHGDSSHSPTHDYPALAEDVELFLSHHKLPNPTLIGHSMGAKTAMTVALRGRTPISSLIPVDNAPVDAALSSDFATYLKGMRAIEDGNVSKQSEADTILTQYESSLPIRQFLLTNLVRDQSSSTPRLKFRVPLDYLGPSLDKMADFPFRDPDEARYEGPTLFVRGTQSKYVADDVLPVIGRFFPRFRVVDVESAHWVISEKPEDFRRAVVDFLLDRD